MDYVRIRDDNSGSHPAEHKNLAGPLIQPDPSISTPNTRALDAEDPSRPSLPPATSTSSSMLTNPRGHDRNHFSKASRDPASSASRPHRSMRTPRLHSHIPRVLCPHISGEGSIQSLRGIHRGAHRLYVVFGSRIRSRMRPSQDWSATP